MAKILVSIRPSTPLDANLSSIYQDHNQNVGLSVTPQGATVLYILKTEVKMLVIYKPTTFLGVTKRCKS